MNNIFFLGGNIYKIPMIMFAEDEKGYWDGFWKVFDDFV